MILEIRSDEERALIVEALDLLVSRIPTHRIPAVGLVAADEARKVRLADELIDRVRLLASRS